MSISISLLTDFQNIFSGNLSAYGKHIYAKEIKEGLKETGKSWTENSPVSESIYKDHLEGKYGIGIAPIKPISNTCTFCVIDVDVYAGTTVEEVVSTIYKNDFPLLPFKTKSGGLHMYLFFNKNVKAKKARSLMVEFVRVFGLDKKTEIFPKQDKLGEGDSGSWINLPYYNYEKPIQYLYDHNLKPVPLEAAVELIKKKSYDPKVVDDFLSNLPLNDAPPCLQSIYLKGTTDFRNEYLFSLARYYKTKFGDDFEFKVAEANNKLDKPITSERLSKTVISSHKKKDYTYKCKNEPICSLCDKTECKKRQYGIGGEEVSELSYEDFIQYKTDPPFYEWIVNSKSLKFFSESDIITQQRFRELCFRELHTLPIKLKEVNWTAIVNNALQNIIVKEVEEGSDISPGTLFKEYLTEYLEHRSQARTKAQILIDRVYKDTEKQQYVFKPKNLLTFLIQQKQFRYYGQNQMQDKLQQLGAKPERYYIDKDTGTARVWTLPFESLSKFIDDNKDQVSLEIDFSKEDLNEQY